MMGEERTAERLLGVLGRPAELAVHELAALESESRGLVGELGLMGRHAWQRLAESRGRGRGILDVAVLFTDLVGFSDWALASGDELAVKLLLDFSDTVEPPIAERGGEVVKRLGDGLMAAFPDAQSAVEAAFDAHERVAATIEMTGSQAQLKTGVHLGRPRKIGRDYLGIDVNIAARLLEAAKPGEILVSDRTLLALDAATVDGQGTALQRCGRAERPSGTRPRTRPAAAVTIARPACPARERPVSAMNSTPQPGGAVAERVTGATTLGRMVLSAQERGDGHRPARVHAAGREHDHLRGAGRAQPRAGTRSDRARHRGGRGRVDPVLDQGRVDSLRAGRRVRGRGGRADLSHELA